MNKTTTSGPVLRCDGLEKGYRQGASRLPVLQGLDLTVQPGELVAVLGSSGSGKSTLLHCLGGLDRPDGGKITVTGEELWKLPGRQRDRLRNSALGFIYQFHHLLGEFSALENVAMPLLIRGDDLAAVKERATDLLERVGLAERIHHKPGELSGGERQRAAVARALACNPACILGDEPTGNLDETNANRVFDMMLELNREQGTSLVLVTHDPRLAARMDRRLELRHGVLHPIP